MYIYIYIWYHISLCVYVCNFREQGFRVWLSGSRQSRVEDLKIPGFGILGLASWVWGLPLFRVYRV